MYHPLLKSYSYCTKPEIIFVEILQTKSKSAQQILVRTPLPIINLK